MTRFALGAAALIIAALSTTSTEARGFYRYRYFVPATIHSTSAPAHCLPGEPVMTIRHGYYPQMFRNESGYGEG